jgi:hypothetical protein
MWNQMLHALPLGGPAMALAWLPWLLHAGLGVALAAWLWTRRDLPPEFRILLLACAALPFLRFGVSQAFAFGRGYALGWSRHLLTLFLGPVLSLALAALVAGVSPRRGTAGPAGVVALLPAVAGLAAMSGDWFLWALLPLVAILLGRDLPLRLADPAIAEDGASPAALWATGWLASGAAALALLVPLLGSLAFRGAVGPLPITEGLALMAASVTWNILGIRWSGGRGEGRILRILAWGILGLPFLLLAGLVLLLLVFKPRLF